MRHFTTNRSGFLWLISCYPWNWITRTAFIAPGLPTSSQRELGHSLRISKTWTNPLPLKSHFMTKLGTLRPTCQQTAYWGCVGMVPLLGMLRRKRNKVKWQRARSTLCNGLGSHISRLPTFEPMRIVHIWFRGSHFPIQITYSGHFQTHMGIFILRACWTRPPGILEHRGMDTAYNDDLVVPLFYYTATGMKFQLHFCDVDLVLQLPEI